MSNMDHPGFKNFSNFPLSLKLKTEGQAREEGNISEQKDSAVITYESDKEFCKTLFLVRISHGLVTCFPSLRENY